MLLPCLLVPVVVAFGLIGSASAQTIDPACGQAFTPTYAIQGSGGAAAITGTVVTQGVVVGDFEGSSGLQGFYLQDATGDGDAATSDGIFVFTGSANTVTAGQIVRVSGFARERFNQTALNGSNSNSAVVPASNIVSCGSGSVTPADVELPFASSTFLERFEGMLVQFGQSLVVSEYFNYDRFGEIVLALPPSGESRLFTPTSVVEPGADAQARLAEYALRRITLDDGLSLENPSFTRHPNGDAFTLSNRFRGGDTVRDAVGVLGFDFNLYRIQPTAPAIHTAVNARPDTPEESSGDVKVAAMNTLNFFVTLDFPTGDPLDNKCGPLQNVECRGADSNQPAEFTRQRDKLVAALAGMDADVVGLNELENTAGVDPLAGANGLVPALNAVVGAGTYDSIATGTIGIDAIKVGLIYKPEVVTPVGPFELLTKAVDSRFDDTLNRPVLAQSFEVNATGDRFTVAVNHLKSKTATSPCPGDPDVGDGQGVCSGTRTAAAEALVDWLSTDPTGSGDRDFLITGDLNSYALEDPIDAVREGPDDTLGTADDYTNLIARYEGRHAYSFVFDGQAGYLDHALASPTFADQVSGAREWHINADEPDLIDYDTSFKSPAQDALYAPDAFRSSDHDPALVFFCASLPGCASSELEEAADGLEAIQAGGATPKLVAALSAVEDALRRLYRTPDRHAAVVKIEVATGDVEAAQSNGALSASQGEALLEQLATAARFLVVDAIGDAAEDGGGAGKIADAEDLLRAGDAQRAAGNFKEAIVRYKQAISKAETA